MNIGHHHSHDKHSVIDFNVKQKRHLLFKSVAPDTLTLTNKLSKDKNLLKTIEAS